MSKEYNGAEKFGWTKDTAPKFTIPQCSTCTNNFVAANGIVECDIFGQPRPEKYVDNIEKCLHYEEKYPKKKKEI